MRSRLLRLRSALAAVVLVLVCALTLVEALAGGRLLMDGGLLLAAGAALAAGAWSRTVQTGVAVLAGAALMTAASQVADPGVYAVADDAVFSLVVLGAPALLGAGWAARARQLRELRRLYALRAEQVAAQVETARIAETNRIAGMVQTGVVQTLGAILVRAEGALGRGTAGTGQDAVARRVALTEIEQSTRDALDQMRGHIGSLRAPSDGPVPTSVHHGVRERTEESRGEVGRDVDTAVPDTQRDGVQRLEASDAGPRARPPRAPVDLLAALAALPISVEVAVTDHAVGPTWAAVLAPLALAWPLTQRRRRPVAAVVMWCVLAVAISLALVPLQGLVSTILPLMLIGSAVGAGLRSWAGRLACVALLVAVCAAMSVSDQHAPDQEALLATSLVLVLATVAGVVSAAGAARVRTLDDLVRTVELNRHLEVGLAVARQRQALARDLHDSVAACATIICLQAGAAQALSDDEVVLEVLRTVVTTARDGIREVRTSLDLVADASEPAAVGGVDALVAVARRAGLDVHLHTPVPVLLTPTQEVVVRVVREAIVNASRHAPGARVEVSMEAGAEALVVRVSDDGAARGLDAGRTDACAGTGTGLAGLAERVALHGGTLTHGPLRPCGYAVRLTLPGPSAEPRVGARDADQPRVAPTPVPVTVSVPATFAGPRAAR